MDQERLGNHNTIHSPCQIELFNNTCDDKSHHVGGKKVLDGYETPLECRSGLMYMSILGKLTDQDLDQYHHVLLTSPHEWDPSVLDYVHPRIMCTPTHMDTLLGHLTLQLWTNMIPG